MTITTKIKKPAHADSSVEAEGFFATDHPQRTTDNNFCYAANLGLRDYKDVWQLQQNLVTARIDGTISADILLFVEHPPVFTLGRRGGRQHLLVSETFLKTSGIPVVHVERGGNITYHGPGQLVAYPIIDLETRRIGVVDFVQALEEIMLRTAADHGVAAGRNPVNRGIWVGDNKMGSIGIALRKGISFHGLALNVNVDLTPFGWIQPCGLEGVAMTSMKQELGRQLPLADVCRTLKHYFASIIKLDLRPLAPEELQQQLKPGI